VIYFGKIYRKLKVFSGWIGNYGDMNTLTIEDAVLPMDNDPWIFRELGQAQFGDARLTRRAMILAQD